MNTRNYIPRQLEQTIRDLVPGFPCIAITGARQAGKTTLARKLFPDKPYVSLEDLDQREFAGNDPKGFLDRFPDGAILDEVQRAPSLFSYLQARVDDDERMGLFILTGSQHFHLTESITQSLAGRTAMLNLTPFSMKELSSVSRLPENPDETILTGGYPPLFSRKVQPHTWFENYTGTYIERDVRSVINVRDLMTFRKFIRLCAGRVGQLVNLSSLGAECGVSHNTVRSWLSVLEASAIIFFLQPWFRNFNKRLVKTPKIYFFDTGLLCNLLGILETGHLRYHPQRGSIFENLVVAEAMKERLNQGRKPNLYFFRDRSGFELDLIVDEGQRLDAVEIKSGKTVTGEFFQELNRWKDIAGDLAGKTWLIYGGEEKHLRQGHHVLPWDQSSEILHP